ncbi:hypothetical protein BK127_41800 [Paenibacillus sp. FSL H7-0331]|nr:hypothetical protein BK127_41800 [Paenibacillus sp. FSL H7-0331]
MNYTRELTGVPLETQEWLAEIQNWQSLDTKCRPNPAWNVIRITCSGKEIRHLTAQGIDGQSEPTPNWRTCFSLDQAGWFQINATFSVEWYDDNRYVAH